MLLLGFSALGTWQLRRHEWRGAWIAERNARLDLPPVALSDAIADPGSHRDRRARAQGRFVPEASIAVREVTPAGEEGYAIWTPLLPAGGDGAGAALLVERGFVPATALEAFLKDDAAAGAEEAAVVGRVIPLALQPVAPRSAAEARREWLRFDGSRPDAVAALQAQLPFPLLPVAIEAQEGPAGTLPRAGVTRPVSPVSHLGYAVFWFGMAGGTVVTWIGLGRQRVRDAERAERRASLPAHDPDLRGDAS